MDKIKIFLIIVSVLIVVLAVCGFIDSRYRKEIDNWAEAHNKSAVSIEYRSHFSRTPFSWTTKTAWIYKVTLSNRNVVWFRFGQFFNSVETVEETIDF